MNWQSGVLVALVTLGAASALLPILLWWLRRNDVVDVPGHRSLHDQPTPRGAGIALAIAMLLGLLAAGGVPWPVWLGVIGFAAIGAWDDLSRQPVGVRFFAQLLLAAIVATGLAQIFGAPVLWAVAGLLVIAATVNATNFMDGLNGITGLQAVVWGIAYVAAFRAIDQVALVPLAVALAAVGLAFLPWNMPKARLFLGDSGSYLIGASAGILAVGGAMAGYPLAFIGPLATYAADTGFAVVQRLRRGERLTEAHRSHVFQQLVALGWSHTRTAFVTAGFTAASAGLALATIEAPLMITVLLLVAIISVNTLYLALPFFIRIRSNVSKGTSA